MTHPPSDRPAWRQVLLGLFILGQLGFLAGATVTTFLEDQKVPVPAAITALGNLNQTYAAATGQFQYWWEFRNVPRHSVFPTAVLDFGPGRPQETLPFLCAPADPEHYVYNLGRVRLSDYEAVLVARLGWYWSRAEIVREPARFRKEQTAYLQEVAPPARAYLAWRLRGYQAEHPNAEPPRAMVLLMRVYLTPPPYAPFQRKPPEDLPLARWVPGTAALERYDFPTGRFVPLPEPPAGLQ
jgi:hypothetical protein